jgi:hypothetical protein
MSALRFSFVEHPSVRSRIQPSAFRIPWNRIGVDWLKVGGAWYGPFNEMTRPVPYLRRQ